jgi:hypothetical protein
MKRTRLPAISTHPTFCLGSGLFSVASMLAKAIIPMHSQRRVWTQKIVTKKHIKNPCNYHVSNTPAELASYYSSRRVSTAELT